MKTGKPKAKAVSYKRKAPLYYNPAEEQRILRERSQGRCECERAILNGGVDRCQNLHNQEARNGRKGPAMLSILFLGKKFDYAKAVAWCNFCQWEHAKLISKRAPRKRAAKVEPGQVGMFEGGFFALEAVIWICVVLGLLSAYVLFSSLACSSKAKAMGFKHSWGILQGCMIETKSGVIDIEKYRVIE